MCEKRIGWRWCSPPPSLSLPASLSCFHCSLSFPFPSLFSLLSLSASVSISLYSLLYPFPSIHSFPHPPLAPAPPVLTRHSLQCPTTYISSATKPDDDYSPRAEKAPPPEPSPRPVAWLRATCQRALGSWGRGPQITANKNIGNMRK